MKKRHEQKLIILSLAMLVALNIPFILIFNIEDAIFGIPFFYGAVFAIWLMSIIIAYIVLRRYYE